MVNDRKDHTRLLGPPISGLNQWGKQIKKKKGKSKESMKWSDNKKRRKGLESLGFLMSCKMEGQPLFVLAQI